MSTTTSEEEDTGGCRSNNNRRQQQQQPRSVSVLLRLSFAHFFFDKLNIII